MSDAGKLLIPQEHLYKQNVLLLRGQFRPFTLLHNDMLMGAAQQFFCGPDETSILETSDGNADRSAVFDECVYRDDSTVVLELTTRSMMEVRLLKGDQAFSSFLQEVRMLSEIKWHGHHLVRIWHYEQCSLANWKDNDTALLGIQQVCDDFTCIGLRFETASSISVYSLQ